MANTFPQTPLFHYAFLAEFQQILTTKSLWFTPVDNPADLDNALAFIKQVIAAEYPGISPDLFNLDMSSSYPVYSFSLSAQKDIQSEWPKYYPDGGFSIAIDQDQLSGIMLSYEGFSLYPCLYNDGDKKNFVMNTIINSPYGLDKDQPMFARKIKLINRNILNLAGLLKDESFADEQEWRITASYVWPDMVGGLEDLPPDPLPLDVKTGVQNKLTVNYLDAPVVADPDKVMVKEVVIGPNPDMTQAKLTCQTVIAESEDPANVVITESPLPYNQ
jgi:hypothetical protein